MRTGLRVDVAAAEAVAASDVQDTDNDPQRLLKLSHSLRYQLAQPPRNQPAQRDVRVSLPGTLRNSTQASPQSPMAARDQSVPASTAHQLQQSQRLPLISGPGTKSGPYSGYASKAWLQGEFRQDLDELRRHVDEYASKREQRAFDVERTVLKTEIGHLRKRLAETEAQVVKLQTMLPDEEGEFTSLRAELEELEREADHFCDLYEREAKATTAALQGFRQAVEDITTIEAEFQRIKQIIDQLPDAATQPLAGQPYGMAPPHGTAPNGSPPWNGARTGALHPPADAASPRACCGCIRITARRAENKTTQ
ncbi:hypothetical protein Vretimale_10741 [Volvox reticuliferus]|uniref:Uncharacterized protein n=1 Tax=Volvox reticuliferus TaxID=1737510 RepID=A0A8J4GG37_9CHLO|nr:hypothetical protein Vretifemale_13903 [Volvox reticuliferus]GIM06414.1 hypothetical protein Vretimale_10741 [Volvox reticuliferus]